MMAALTYGGGVRVSERCDLRRAPGGGGAALQALGWERVREQARGGGTLDAGSFETPPPGSART